MPAVVELRGMKELQAKLNKLDNVGNTLRLPMVQSAEQVRSYTAQYPQATSANRAHGTVPDRYYQRGTGSVYVGKSGVRVVKRSEMLNRSWSIRYGFSSKEAQATIGTRASYAKWVHDERKQARIHAMRGWRTAQNVFKVLSGQITRRFDAAIEAALK